MNSSGALTLVHRAVAWTHWQAVFTGRCLVPKHQVLMKASQLRFCSLASTNLLTTLRQPELYPHFYAQRNYATKKGAKKKAGAQVNMTGLGELIEVEQMVKNMEDNVETMKLEFVKSLSLRSAGSVEAIKIKFEGKEYELQQVAKMTRKGQQTIVIDMLSFPQMTKAVVEALKTSALNLNPQQEGTTIFVPIPKVTKEHREILAKKAKALFITCRDNIKKVQEVYVKELRGNDMGDSEKQSAYKQVKAIADKYVSQSEEMMKAKQDELLGKS